MRDVYIDSIVLHALEGFILRMQREAQRELLSYDEQLMQVNIDPTFEMTLRIKSAYFRGMQYVADELETRAKQWREL